MDPFSQPKAQPGHMSKKVRVNKVRDHEQTLSTPRHAVSVDRVIDALPFAIQTSHSMFDIVLRQKVPCQPVDRYITKYLSSSNSNM